MKKLHIMLETRTRKIEKELCTQHVGLERMRAERAEGLGLAKEMGKA